jgi:hypothetical protein
MLPPFQEQNIHEDVKESSMEDQEGVAGSPLSSAPIQNPKILNEEFQDEAVLNKNSL